MSFFKTQVGGWFLFAILKEVSQDLDPHNAILTIFPGLYFSLCFLSHSMMLTSVGALPLV